VALGLKLELVSLVEQIYSLKRQNEIIVYVSSVESTQLTTVEEERGEAERLKLIELIVLLSKPVTYTILISNKR